MAPHLCRKKDLNDHGHTLFLPRFSRVVIVQKLAPPLSPVLFQLERSSPSKTPRCLLAASSSYKPKGPGRAATPEATEPAAMFKCVLAYLRVSVVCAYEGVNVFRPPQTDTQGINGEITTLYHPPKSTHGREFPEVQCVNRVEGGNSGGVCLYEGGFPMTVQLGT